MGTVWIRDQTARSVQSDLDLHIPQKPLSSSTVRGELNVVLIPKVIPWRSLAYQFFSWLSHTSTGTTFFSKPPTTFLTCIGDANSEIRL